MSRFERVQAPMAPEETNWSELLEKLLPSRLPDEKESCKASLRSIFRTDLPGGVLQATVLLVVMGAENEARTLLVDFFRENRKASKIALRLKMQLFFHERRKQGTERSSQEQSTAVSNHSANRTQEADEISFAWTPVTAEAMPLQNDADLRRLAAKAQEMISETAAGYGEALVPDWASLDDQPATAAQAVADDETAVNRELTDLESRLIEQVTGLGEDAITLLTYFHENPGDRSSHAADMLGYEITEVNKLLNNRLSKYVCRYGSGGWACVEWVCRVLENIPRKIQHNL